MKIWMSYNNRKEKSKFSLFAYFLGLILLDFILIITTIVWFIDSKYIISLSFIVITSINVVVAIRIGASRTRDNLIFLRDNKDALFVVDISKFIRYRRGLLGLYSMESDRVKILNNIISKRKFEDYLIQENSLHGIEIEIENIESMKVRRDGIHIVCRVIYPNYNKGRVSYFIKNGYEDQESLINSLECRMLPFGNECIVDKSHKGQLILSSSFLLLDTLLCVTSYPTLGIVNHTYYFYFLGAILPISCWFLHVVITIRKGL